MNWAIDLLRPYRYWLLPAALMAVFFGCLTQQEPDTFSLPEQFADSLSRYDSVHIILKDSSGKTLDLLFHGKVVSAAQLRNMPAPHALDAKMRVTIIGYQGGQVTYLVDRIYDGITNRIESHQPLILPTSKVRFGIPELRIPKKTTLPFPTVSVEPAHLADKSLLWASSNPKIFQIEEKGLRGIAPGTAYLQVSLRSDTAKHAEIPITVIPNPKLPDSLKIAPDTLKVAAKGRTGQFTVQAFPLTANAVSWHIEDLAVASITGEGQVQGLKRGTARVTVVSKEDETITDSALVAVSDPVSVKRVRFLNPKLELFVEGAAEILRTETLPAEANPEVAFSVRDSSIARVLEGRILGLREGETVVTVRSMDNPTQTDSLRLKVHPTQKVDSIRLSPDTLRLYVGGESKTLQATLYPSTLAPLIQWTSASPAIAAVDSAGEVRPITAGNAVVTATSRADSGKKAISLIRVKRDVPILDVGRDTTIPLGRTLTFTPKVTQEYGTVARFKWDLDGDGAWDDSSAELKSLTYKYDQEKEVAVLFYVRDSEGNDTSVVKRVKAVTGPVINIFSPLNNAYTNTSPVAVSWSVDGKDQEAFLKEALKEGTNTVTRTAKDGLGNVYSASITVYYDTTAPDKPIVKGPAIAGGSTPTWTWTSGGKGGVGAYRLSLDKDEFTGASETTDTTYTPDTALKEDIHTLYVQERDAAGNWSLSGKFGIRVDVSGPGTPAVKVSPASITNVRTPVWSWVSGGGGTGSYQYRLDNADLKTGGTATTDTSYTPARLTPGTHTLYVQEKDSVGNWSLSGYATVLIDTIGPNAPMVTSTSSSPTNNSLPTWTWSSGGDGGKGAYRYKLGDTLWTMGANQGAAATFTPATALTEGAWILYVQEQDSAGNWSAAGSKAIQIDLTPPGAPKMDSTPRSPLNSLKPKWTWKSGGGGNGTYRWKLDNANMNAGAVETTTPNFIPESNIPEGAHTLYVQERDAVGNWSVSVARELVLTIRGLLGQSAFSQGVVYSPSLAISNSGTPYVAFQDDANGNRATVMRFNGSSWENVGGVGFSAGVIDNIELAIGSTNEPYVVFKDLANGESATVMRFNGISWQYVGSAGFSGSLSGYPSLAVSAAGVPYIAFSDPSNGYKATVMRFSGTYWETVGNPGFSDGQVNYPKLTLSSEGVPYVGFSDGASGEKATVMRFRGASWEKVGNVGFSAGTAYNASLALSDNDVPSIAYSDDSHGGKVTVMRLNGAVWESVGRPGFSNASALPALALDKSGIPFVAFSDNANGDKAKLVRFNGSEWESVGPVWLSPGGAYGCSLALNNMGIPYLAFVDGANGNKVSVMKSSFEP